jgi:hypothetical protein
MLGTVPAAMPLCEQTEKLVHTVRLFPFCVVLPVSLSSSITDPMKSSRSTNSHKREKKSYNKDSEQN